MKIELSKQELLEIITSMHVPYRRMKPRLAALGEWKFNMDGPTGFSWHINMLAQLDADELYELYKDVRDGNLFLPDEDTPGTYKPIELPFLRRIFPRL